MNNYLSTKNGTGMGLIPGTVAETVTINNSTTAHSSCLVYNCPVCKPFTTIATNSENYEFNIKKVENGWILKHYFQSYVFAHLDDLNKWLKDKCRGNK